MTAFPMNFFVGTCIIVHHALGIRPRSRLWDRSLASLGVVGGGSVAEAAVGTGAPAEDLRAG